jgi:hypothetical protein
MSGREDEPLTENEIRHLQNQFWYHLSEYKENKKEEMGFPRQLNFDEVKEVIEHVSVAMHLSKLDFDLNPHSYSDILGAEDLFFLGLLDEFGLIEL